MSTKTPRLRFDGAYFTGSVVLPAWTGYAIGSRRRRNPPRVLIESEVPAEELAGEADPALSDEQLNTLAYLVEHDARIRDAAVASIRGIYAKLRRKYLPYLDDPALMPANGRDSGTLRSLIELRTITLHRVALNGYAYLGLGLGCTWDSEHGVGVMTHRARVVDVGGGDSAILDWIAERDLRAHRRKSKSKKK
jgi:hypothetical protein